MPTVRTRPPAPDASAPPASRYSPAATRIAAAFAVLVIAGAVALLRLWSPDGAGRAAIPSSARAPVLSPAPTASVTLSSPASAERLSRAASPPPATEDRVAGRPAAPSGGRAAANVVAARPTAAPVRRAVFPPQSETEAPIELPPATAREFANRSVGLSVLVGEDGSVKEARVISPLCAECDRAARAAILLYRFKPARDHEGKPIESRVAVPVIISPPENP